MFNRLESNSWSILGLILLAIFNISTDTDSLLLGAQSFIGYDAFKPLKFKVGKSQIKVKRHPKKKADLDIKKLWKIENLAHATFVFYLPLTYSKFMLEINTFFLHLRTLTKDRGIAFTIKFVKETRVAFVRFISGMGPTPHTHVPLDKRGWPLWLPSFNLDARVDGSKYSTSEIETIRLIMTLLTCLRSIILKSNPDFSTIDSPSLGDHSTITDREISYACEALNVKFDMVNSDWTKFHFTMKSGIWGKALMSSIAELPHVLTNKGLLANIKAVGGRELTKLLEKLEGLSRIVNPELSVFGRIVDFSDKEGKTRLVAILDYWSQTALFNVHKVLFSILRKIEVDCTFDQGKFKTILTSLPGPFYSYDLFAATDRMPLALQMRVMERIIGWEKAVAWAKLLAERPYMTSLGTPIFYKVGQPMGGYSSWPAMALTHHVIVQVAAHRARVKGYLHNLRFQDYVLLGDDIVIANTFVASEYLEILQSLDMPISLAKSIESNDSFEFAKRLFVNQIEVTGFSLGGLGSVKRSWSLLQNFLVTQGEHGWLIPFETQLQYVFYLLNSWGYRNPTTTLRTYRIFYFIVKLNKSLIDGEFWESFLRSLLRPGINLTLPEGLSPRQFLLREIACVRLAKMKEDTGKMHSGLLDTLEKNIYFFKKAFSSELLVGALTSGLPGVLTVLGVVKASIQEAADFAENFHTGLTKPLGHSITPDIFSNKDVIGEAAIVKPLVKRVEDYITDPITSDSATVKFYNFDTGVTDFYTDYNPDIDTIKNNVKNSLIVWGRWTAINCAFPPEYDVIFDPEEIYNFALDTFMDLILTMSNLKFHEACLSNTYVDERNLNE
jgi:hypothetical protein